MMDLRVFFMSMTIGFLLSPNSVTLAQESDDQDAQDLEALYRRTFSEESIAQMAEIEKASEAGIETDSAGGSTIFLESNTATFQLFTQSNPEDPYPLELDDTENLGGSHFDSERRTKVIIHGWQATVSSSWIKDMIAKFLADGDYNIITVDWAAWSMMDYLPAQQSTGSVGSHTAQLLTYLNGVTNLSFSDVHLVGHSLGAHVAGFAGAQLGGVIDRITGMDPAGPLFEVPEIKPPDSRLDYTDAIFVDIIHTCVGIVGFYIAIGDVDFYPNGGTCNQPGCDLSLTCSHGMSHQYMTDSILYPDEFYAEKCGSFRDYDNGDCRGAESAVMGYSVSRDARGVFYLSTNAESPYGRGENRDETNEANHEICSITLTMISIIIGSMYEAHTLR